MELCLRAQPDGTLRVCKLQNIRFGRQHVSQYVASPYLTLEQVVQFVQHLGHDQFQVKRVNNSRTWLHWNIGVPCQANKKGVKTIFKVTPSQNFDAWEIMAIPAVFDCVIPTKRKVLWGSCSMKTFSLPPQPMKIAYDGGIPHRVIEWTQNTCKILGYVLRYHAESLSVGSQSLLEGILPRSSVTRRLLRLGDGADFLSFVGQLPGKKLCIFTQECGDDGYVVPNVGRLQLFCWVAPWALAAKDKCNHLQVDASFKGSAPYAYYVPQAVIANRGLACGLVIAPTEKAELYAAFDEVFGTTFDVPILSDLGKAIKAYAKGREVPHYWCHRHLFELTGSNSYGAHLFGGLLLARSEHHLDSMIPQFVADVSVFANAGLIAPAIVLKFEKYLGAKFSRDTSGLLTGALDSEPKPQHTAKWALYARSGCATCTNQAEAFHKAVNMKIARSSPFMTKLRNLVTRIQENKGSINSRIIEGIQRAQENLVQDVDRLRAAGVTVEERDTCMCASNRRNGLLYQTDGFCIHTCRTKRVSAHEACLQHEGDLQVETQDPEIRYQEDIWEVPQEKQKRHPKFNMFSAPNLALLSDSRLGSFLRSLSYLIEKEPTDTFEIFYRYVSSHDVPASDFDQMNPETLANLKLAIVREATSEPQVSASTKSTIRQNQMIFLSTDEPSLQ